VENLLTPDYVRRLMWEPPVEDDDGTLPDLVEARLTTLGARRWQVELTRDVLVAAIRDAKPGVATESAPSPAP
jgi:ribonuclease D